MATNSGRTSYRSNKSIASAPKSSKKPENKCRKLIMKNLILILTLMAVCVGIGLGLFLRKCDLSDETIRLINFPGEIFMNMLKMMIVPLITTSLITGLAQLGGKSSRKMMGIAFSYYMATTVMAVTTGIVLVLLLHPGTSNQPQMSNGTALVGQRGYNKVTTTDTMLDIVRNIFPANIAQAFMQSAKTDYKEVVKRYGNNTNDTGTEYTKVIVYKDGVNTIGILTFCIAVGICLSEMGQKSKIVVEFLSVLGECVSKIIGLMMWAAPLGIISLLIGKILQAPELIGLLTKLAWFILTVVSATSIHWLITLNLLYVIFARRNPFKFFKAMLPAHMTVLATSSSAATLPVTLMCTEETLGIQKAVTRFVLPVGATINMDGTALYSAVTAVFVAQLNNIELSLGQMLTISLIATLTSIGASAVPSVGMLTIIMVLQSVGLPIEDIALLLTVDWILDRYQTVANVTGDAVAAAIVDRYVKVEEDNDESDNSTEVSGERSIRQGKFCTEPGIRSELTRSARAGSGHDRIKKMGDKSCYMGAGGYTAPTATVNAGSNYAREDYAYGGSSSGGSSGGSTNNQSGGGQPQVYKARTDQSCYLGPN